jgi:hypothetical protein
MRKIIIAQFIVLLIGTVFAWLNFLNELMNWLAKSTCATGCAAVQANPFLAPCFYGAIFFTIALILGAIILRRVQK